MSDELDLTSPSRWTIKKVKSKLVELDQRIQSLQPTEQECQDAEKALLAIANRYVSGSFERVVWCDSPVSAYVAKTIYGALEGSNAHSTFFSNGLNSTINNQTNIVRGYRRQGYIRNANLSKYIGDFATSRGAAYVQQQRLQDAVTAITRTANFSRSCVSRRTYREWWHRTEVAVGMEIAASARRTLRNMHATTPIDGGRYGPAQAMVDEIIDQQHLKLDEVAISTNHLDPASGRHLVWTSDLRGLLHSYGTVTTIAKPGTGVRLFFERLAKISIAMDCCCATRSVIFAARRPKRLLLNEQGQLHAIDVPAAEYEDGFKICAVNGTLVPVEWYTQREKLTATVAMRWRNIEQRRAAFEILGWDNILREFNASTLDEHPNPEIGTLLRCEVPGMGRISFLRVRCGTGRFFAIPVPDAMSTALQANAWTYGRSAHEFVPPEVRT